MRIHRAKFRKHPQAGYFYVKGVNAMSPLTAKELTAIGDQMGAENNLIKKYKMSISQGAVLLWDEPEANINPQIIPELVEILLELSRNGVQIFVATHDYFLAKYIEVLSEKTDSVKFHSLYKTDAGVKCESSDKFSTLTNNGIITEKIRLYETEIEKVTG
jgi:ABC-type lipoprotein export system ATPase subunit